MKILKVIVDELPQSCEKCQYSKELSNERAECSLTYCFIAYPYVDRLPNCPLQLERTCGNCKHYGAATRGYCDNICGICGIVGREDYCSRWERIIAVDGR